MSEIGEVPSVAEEVPQVQPQTDGEGGGEGNQLKPEEKVATAAGTPSTTPVSGASTPNTPATPPGKSAPSFKAQFKAFSKFGDTKSDGQHLTLSQSDKWMKQASIFSGKKITTTDTGIYFKKLKQQKLGFDDYNKFLEDLTKNKKVDLEEMKSKMANCGSPGLTGVAAGGKSATVERLTDTSRYTGAHKQRFDESGKGRGIAGRKDVADSSGYVQGYQHKDSYNKNH